MFLSGWGGNTEALRGAAESSYRIGEYARTGGKIGMIRRLIGHNEPPSPAEIRLAGRLGEDPDEVQYMANLLWKKPFETHRDELAGAESSPQRKGQIARQLQKELKAAFESKRLDPENADKDSPKETSPHN